MKKLFLTFSLCLPFMAFSSSYEKLRTHFEDQLYTRQVGLMKKNEYKKFIQPYLNRAEEELEIVAWCKKNPDSELAKNYLNLLVDYNVATFKKCVISHNLIPAIFNANRNVGLEKYSRSLRGDLWGIIEQIKKEARLESLDPQQEVKKTEALLRQVNEKFYNQLSFKTRLYLKLFA